MGKKIEPDLKTILLDKATCIEACSKYKNKPNNKYEIVIPNEMLEKINNVNDYLAFTPKSTKLEDEALFKGYDIRRVEKSLRTLFNQAINYSQLEKLKIGDIPPPDSYGHKFKKRMRFGFLFVGVNDAFITLIVAYKNSLYLINIFDNNDDIIKKINTISTVNINRNGNKPYKIPITYKVKKGDKSKTLYNFLLNCALPNQVHHILGFMISTNFATIITDNKLHSKLDLCGNFNDLHNGDSDELIRAVLRISQIEYEELKLKLYDIFIKHHGEKYIKFHIL